MSGHRHPTMNSSTGDGLRKAFSYEPLANLNDSSSSDGDRPSPDGGVRFGHRRLKANSMSPLKSFCKHESSPSSSDDDEEDDEQPEIEPGTGAYLKPEHEDDVFVDRFPGDFPPQHDEDEQAIWPKSPQEFKKSEELALAQSEASAVDAQGIYPPTACIFVANLTQTVRDDRLEAEVTRIFSRFGTTFVKIRRDSRQMPFAFCQYTCEKDAELAVEEGKGIVIFGRACRTEKAKANSVFIVYKASGSPISENDAFRLLDPLGAISNIELLDEKLREEFGLPPAAVVYFKMYDSRRDVLKAVKSQKRFVVLPYGDGKVTKTSTPSSAQRSRANTMDQLARYEIDRRSAYFGNLPRDMTEEELREIAISCGQVGEVTLNRKPIAGGSAETVFGFVEFIRPDSVEDVVRTYHNFELRGHIIRVQRKQSRIFEAPPQSPHPRTPAPIAPSPYQYRGRGYTPAGPSSYGRHSASLSRSSRPPVLDSPSSGYNAQMRTPVRNFYNTPGQPTSRFSDSSQESFRETRRTPASSSRIRTREPWSTPARFIPERVSSVRHSIQSSSSPSAHEETTPKYKGKAPVRPVYLYKHSEAKPRVSFSQDMKEPNTSPKAKLDDKIKSAEAEEEEEGSDSNSEAKAEASRQYDADDEDDRGKDEKAQGEKTEDVMSEDGKPGDGKSEDEERNAPEKRPGHLAPPPPPPPPYSMPYGYIPSPINPYGHPSMPYGMGGAYAPPLHPAILNSYMGYPPGFIWSDPYGNPMYTGLGPGMTSPPKRSSSPDAHPTPTRTGAADSQNKNKLHESSEAAGKSPEHSETKKKSTEPFPDNDKGKSSFK